MQTFEPVTPHTLQMHRSSAHLNAAAACLPRNHPLPGPCLPKKITQSDVHTLHNQIYHSLITDPKAGFIYRHGPLTSAYVHPPPFGLCDAFTHPLLWFLV